MCSTKKEKHISCLTRKARMAESKRRFEHTRRINLHRCRWIAAAAAKKERCSRQRGKRDGPGRFSQTTVMRLEPSVFTQSRPHPNEWLGRPLEQQQQRQQGQNERSSDFLSKLRFNNFFSFSDLIFSFPFPWLIIYILVDMSSEEDILKTKRALLKAVESRKTEVSILVLLLLLWMLFPYRISSHDAASDP